MIINIIKIAWRNIWRNKRRSIITMAALLFSMALFVISLGFAEGGHTAVEDNIIDIHTAHIEVHKKGYLENPNIKSTIIESEKLTKIISDEKYIKGISQRLKGQGLISTATKSGGVNIVGINPEEEAKVSVLSERIKEGSYASLRKKNSILVGKRLAEKLGVALGDKVVLMVQSRTGELKADALRVTGIFNFGLPEADKFMVFIGLPQAEELFEIRGEISEIAVKLTNRYKLEEVAKSLRAKIDTIRFEVLTWKQVNPGLVQYIKIDDAGLWIMMIVVFIVIALGIFNTMLMSILERIHEIGIMLSMGVKRNQIVLIIVFESLFLALLSIIIGGVIGGATNYYFQIHGIHLTGLREGFEQMAVPPIIYAYFKMRHLYISGFSVIIVAVLSSIYPAIRAASLKPVDAIRHV